MPRQGLGVLREQTRQFIGENPVVVVLQRNTRVSDGAGGFTTSPTTLPPQTVRMITENRMVSVERRTVSGEVTRPDFNMVTEWDANIERGDTFRLNGSLHEVVYVHDLNYEKKAEVSVR